MTDYSFLVDRTNDRAYATVLWVVSVCLLSVTLGYVGLLCLNGAS